MPLRNSMIRIGHDTDCNWETELLKAGFEFESPYHYIDYGFQSRRVLAYGSLVTQPRGQTPSSARGLVVLNITAVHKRE